jgi:addiction module HigA family antidote
MIASDATHPGEVLREEYLIPLGLSARALAKELDVPANRLTEIMRGTRDVSAKAEKTHSYKNILPRTAA